VEVIAKADRIVSHQIRNGNHRDPTAGNSKSKASLIFVTILVIVTILAMMMGMLVMHDLLHLQHGSARRDCGTLLIEVQRRIVTIAN